MDSPNYIFGHRIVISELAAKMVPHRQLAPKDWHRRRGYAARVQKKWIRRWGRVEGGAQFFWTRDSIIMSRRSCRALELQLAQHRGADPHRLTTSVMFGRPFDEVTPEERRAAKTANLQMMYMNTPVFYNDHDRA